MKIVIASELKAKCLKIMDEVAATGKPVIITKHGVPVAQLVPTVQKPETLFGALQGSVTILGDIVGPIDAAWETLA
ncbi:MAG: type II toxin-antitoxin system Phd/YefM family antitoxin [Dehalococcoidia bacterium]|nr:type II toxin-antitoxin system Phd/YefM family antitoxin [Dehalococcoidia bacterium]